MIALWIFLGVAMALTKPWMYLDNCRMIKDRVIVGAISVSMLEAAWFLLTYLFIKYILLSYGVIL